jgi:hypothetical protein
LKAVSTRSSSHLVKSYHFTHATGKSPSFFI